MRIDGLKDGMRPVVAIIQARMSSTRLPGKVMKEICGHPVLFHVVNRLRSSRLIERVMVATTVEPSDDVIERWCGDNNVACHRGSMQDVLERYYEAAKKAGAGTIVRITADCPLIDPEIVDMVIEKFSAGAFDHAGTEQSYPDGLDTEVFSFQALEKAFYGARLASEREHVTPYIWKNGDIFRLAAVRNAADLSHMRWTVDDEKDFTLVTRIFEGFKCAGRAFNMKEILDFLGRNPDLPGINSATVRNEGYAKSLREDKTIR
ncbi:MAG: glycosyltransferase family protein [Deltaproteobacteria bacterium]